MFSVLKKKRNEIQRIRGIEVNLFMGIILDDTFIAHMFSVKCAQFLAYRL